jgi:glycosyltransferase involved in cell wall biosynthesis
VTSSQERESTATVSGSPPAGVVSPSDVSSPMRVLQLGPYPPPHGGVQSNLVAIRNLLRKRKIPCSVINITRHRKPEADQVYYPQNTLGLLWLLFQLEYDIIHLHLGGNLTNRLLGLSLICCLIPGKKAVLTFHSGGYPSSPQGREARPTSRTGFVMRRFDMLIGVNPAIVEFFHKLGVPPSRTRLIYPHSFSAEIAGTDFLPKNLAAFFNNHNPVLISVGLLEKEYDLPLQIQVLGRIRENYPRAGLLLIGSGSLEAELRALIAAQPYADAVLLTGDVPHRATLRAIAQSDLMLRTTLYDGDAVSVREALYLGVPVIASDNGMRPSGVRPMPSQDLNALDRTIVEVLSSDTKRSDRSSPADETNIQAVFEVYKELMVRSR